MGQLIIKLILILRYLLEGALMVLIASFKDSTAVSIAFAIALISALIAFKAPAFSPPSNLVRVTLSGYAIWGLFIGAWVITLVVTIYIFLIDPYIFEPLMMVLLKRLFPENFETNEIKEEPLTPRP
jgi:hypothetical protein